MTIKLAHEFEGEDKPQPEHVIDGGYRALPDFSDGGENVIVVHSKPDGDGGLVYRIKRDELPDPSRIGAIPSQLLSKEHVIGIIRESDPLDLPITTKDGKVGRLALGQLVKQQEPTHLH